MRYDGKTDRQIVRESMRGAGVGDAEIDARMDDVVALYVASLPERLHDPKRGVGMYPGVAELIDAVQRGELKMPPTKPLSPVAVETLTHWVKIGAPWPETADKPAADAWKRHWAFQPIARPPLPDVKNASWPRGAIDRLVLAQLEARGLAPSPEANRYTLIKR